MRRGRLGRADSHHLKPRCGEGGERGRGESGFDGFSNRARERVGGGRVEVGGGPDGWTPPVSRQGERGGREGIGWARPKKEKGGALVLGQNGREKGREERKAFPFYFPNKIFKLFSK